MEAPEVSSDFQMSSTASRICSLTSVSFFSEVFAYTETPVTLKTTTPARHRAPVLQACFFKLIIILCRPFFQCIGGFCILVPEADAGDTDHLVEQHEHGRQEQDNSKHTYNSASCHQITEGTDNVHVGIQGNTEGGGEQSHGADDNGRNGTFRALVTASRLSLPS